MFSCRAAWQRFGPSARRAATRFPQDAVQRRTMSSVPGGSRDNIVYYVLCGGAMVGVLSYGYSTVTSDNARFSERIQHITNRSKDEWAPKPWPPKSKGEDEVLLASVSTVEVPKIDEVKDELAPTNEDLKGDKTPEPKVAKPIKDVSPPILEIPAPAQVIEKTFMPVENVIQAPVLVVEEGLLPAEDPSAVKVPAPNPVHVDVKESIAYTNLSVERFPAAEDAAIVEEPSAPADVVPTVEETPLQVQILPAVEETSATKEVLAVEETPGTHEVVPVLENLAPLEVAPAVEETPPAEEVPVVEETPAQLAIVPVIGATSDTEEVIPVKEAPVPLEIIPAVEICPTEEVVPVVEKTPAELEVVSAVETTPTEEVVPVEDTSAQLAVVPVIEETAATEEVILVKETPVSLEIIPAVEEIHPTEDDVSFVEETPVPLEVVPTVEETPATEALAPSVEEISVPVEVASITDEVMALEEVGSVTEKFVLPTEEITSPLVEEVLAPEILNVPTALTEEPVVCAEVAGSILKEADKPIVETPAEDVNKEYIIVVLEGKPKEEKRPKVLGVSPLIGRIIPATEHDSTPPSEVGQSHLRMQMQ